MIQILPEPSVEWRDPEEFHVPVTTANNIGALETLANLMVAPASAAMLRLTFGGEEFLSAEEVGKIQREVARHRRVLAQILDIPAQERLANVDFIRAAHKITATKCHIPPKEFAFLRQR